MLLSPIVELIRLEEGHNYGTFGVLKINKEVFCVTLEPPDYENIVNRSSIPAQQYLCSVTDSPTFGKTYEVRHVPNRSMILFHPGNYVHNTEGCILLAEHFGKIRGDRAVLNSGNTFKKFMDIMSKENYPTFSLTVKEVF